MVIMVVLVILVLKRKKLAKNQFARLTRCEVSRVDRKVCLSAKAGTAYGVTAAASA